MKKAFFLIITACLFLVSSGCQVDQYAIEKQYWKIQKEAEKIFNNPHASPPKELETTVNLLNRFIQKYPGTNLAIEAGFNIAKLYIVKEEYDKSRAQLNTLMNKYNKSESISADAVFLIGTSYEKEDNWNLALQQYKKIMREYPVTVRGLDIPIYIAQHYKIKYQPDKMLSAFQEAANYYRTLSDKYPNSQLAYTADSLIAKCYIAIKDWHNAIISFNTIIEKYNGKSNLDGVLMSMALIYVQELKDNIKAKEVLESLIKQYPHSNLIKTATALLRKVDKK